MIINTTNEYKLNCEVKIFDPNNTSEDLWKQIVALYQIRHKDIYPDGIEPLPSYDILKTSLTQFSEYQDIERYIIITKDDKLLGMGSFIYYNECIPSYDQLKHIGTAYVLIYPQFRKKGLGTKLLQEIIKKAKDNNKTIIQTKVLTDIGKSFCEYLSGSLAKEGTENRLYLNQIDWDKMHKWKETEMKGVKNIKIETYHDLPEKHLKSFCEAYTEIANDEPSGELEEQKEITPEYRRSIEQEFKNDGTTLTTKIAVNSSDSVIGLTEILYDPDRGHRILQFMTGVIRKHRGQGIGKLLKADALFYIKKQYPEVKYIISGNANLNAPILHINNSMGYKKVLSRYEYKFSVETLSRKLKN